MSRSFNHIIDANGEFSMASIVNMDDAREALEECFNIILKLSEMAEKGIPCAPWYEPKEPISEACKSLGYTDPFTEHMLMDKRSDAEDLEAEAI